MENCKDDIVFQYSINPLWDVVEEIREKVKSLTESFGEDICESSIMTASELVENSLKYGKSVEEATGIQFELFIHEDKISILVKNRVISVDDTNNVKDVIDKIKKSNNPKALYTQRLTELMENPKPGVSQLGLLRIVYEGDFMLDYQFNDPILTVIATRKI